MRWLCYQKKKVCGDGDDSAFGGSTGCFTSTPLIALLTVSFQAINAALVNPIESLRNE